MHIRPCMLISACLLGVHCRYDGTGCALSDLDDLMRRYELIPVCPEQLGGLPTPRTPSERRGDRVLQKSGADVTSAFRAGAEQTCCLARIYGARSALLKARSPSCGSGEIYDGRFTGRRVAGNGVAAQMLKEMGVAVYSEEDIQYLIEERKM